MVEELELEALKHAELNSDEQAHSNVEHDAPDGDASEETEPKRPRLDDKPDVSDLKEICASCLPDHGSEVHNSLEL
ncbi:hypothetical protein CsatB_002746 [Cannabis sativa]